MKTTAPTAKEVGYSPGDIVLLRTGGPRMTVEDVVGRVIHTSWFCPLGKLRRSAFFTEALKPEVES